MKTVRRSKQIKALKYNTDMGLRATLSQVASVLSPKLSQVSSIFSPTPSMNIHRPVKRIQPKRNAKKKKDEDFVYSDVLSTSSLLIGSTLSDSQFVLSTPRCNLALDTQPVLEGNDSISFSETQMDTVVPESQTETVIRETQTETVVPETHIETVVPETQIEYQNVSHTPSISGISPQSRHGSKMMSGLSSLYNYDTSFSLSPVSQSLLPVTHPDISYELSTQLSSTPIGSQYTTVTSPVVSRDSAVQTVDQQTVARATQTDYVHESEHQATQTSRDSAVQTVDQQTAACATQTDNIHELEHQATQTCLQDLSEEHQAALARQVPLKDNVALFRSNGNLSVLSNFYQTKIYYNGVHYRSAEHAFQHCMATFHNCTNVARQILSSRHPARVKKLSHYIAKSKVWHETKTTVMGDILQSKAEQCQIFKQTLLSTGKKRLIHNIDTDDFWGCGPDLNGQNVMGILLEELRCKLQAEENISQSSNSQMMTGDSPKNEETTVTKTETVTGSKELPNTQTIRATKSANPPVTRSSDKSTTQCLPTDDKPSVLILGNSNVRQMATILHDNAVNAQSIFYPGGTLDYIHSRIRHTCDGTPPYHLDGSYPSHVVIMAGDIEAANGMNPDYLNAKYENLFREIRRVYPSARLILVGLTISGSSRRQQSIRRLNALMQHIAANERFVAYADSNNARLKDKIHLSYSSKCALGERISTIIAKPYLDVFKKF